ncbi:NAD(P)/FAD-dependent oxidoreductase [Paludibaculum fermentans]|uniref:FAD-dependent oxidoreductase n=1 Tax=Paludibaculum fermentans TaxID=1473598 RepID=A0A7S7SLZ5_PALFE|nr:NAD(P)/FAD-dependent oxidoreductase [Paludibaculum fermentans]QOY89889.1 FAD-dependent oxidoreductase [Paludibaculum fermentans]
MSNPDVLIVGAGLAGICCARALQKEGVSFQVIEASDSVGGRVRTEKVDGFLLDRGFQVLLTAYPEALEQLDYDRLQLCAFAPGALIRADGRFFRIPDPWREPGAFMTSLFSPIGGFADKFKLSRIRSAVLRKTIEEIFEGEDISTMQALRRRQISQPMIDRFFKPFIGGVMLDPKLTVSNRLFEFVFKMFAEGDAAVPAEGMQAIPRQLAEVLPEGSIRFNERVHSIGLNQVKLSTGEVLAAKQVVVATEGPEASRLLGFDRTISSRSVCTLYFAAKESPVEEPMLVLSGSSRGPINNLAVMNVVAPGYAPAGEQLVSITVLGWPSRDDQTVVSMVRGQLRHWYGLVADEWRLLRMYRIEHGLPVVSPMEWQQSSRLAAGLYVCGDHRSTPSIQGAMESGRLTGEAVIRELKGQPDPVTRVRKDEPRLVELRESNQG